MGQALGEMRRLLQRRKLHLNGQEKAGGGGRKKAEASRVRDLTEGFMADVEWLRWCLTEGLVGRGEESAAPFFWFVKQPHRWTWFGRFLRGGRRVGPGDEGKLEVEGARMDSEIAHSDALGASGEVDLKELCARLVNVGGLEDHEKERRN